MNAKTLVELALKVWGVILLVGALVSLPVALLMVNVPAGNDSQAAWIQATQRGSVLQLVIRAAAGIAVVVWADRITDLIESDTAPLHIDASTHDLRVLGFALVGVFFLLHGLQNIAATAYVWFSKPGWPHLDQADSLSYLWSRQNDAIVRALVQVTAGVLLIFGPRRIATAWSRLRGQSTDDPGDDSESDD